MTNPSHVSTAGKETTITGFPPLDLAGHQQFARAFYAASPDISHTVEEVVGDGAS